MKLTKEQIHVINSSFIKMKNKKDFLGVLNYSKGIAFGENKFPFTLRQLEYYQNPKREKKRYVKFTIKKKSGAERTIHAPSAGLKAIQKCLNLILQVVYEPNEAATGFVPGKSIVDNAKVHAGSLYVYNIDLKDFFPSVDQARVWGRFQYPPFNLNKKNGKLKLANIIASLSCCEMEVERLDENNNWVKVIKRVLPQGAPTSPTITNIICQKLDFYLTAVAKRFGLKYSRYADDITFSSMHNVYQKDSDFIKEIQRIITEQNFHIKESKTRLQKEGYRQEVTGLLVNTKPNVQKRYIKQLRMWLYYWEHYGFERANLYFQSNYKAEKGHTKKGMPSMVNVISGKLDFLKMVKGADDANYKKLKTRFQNQLNLNKKSPSGSHLEDVLNVLLNKGIDDAMELYNNNEI